MTQRLSNKIAIVTGGAGGIGEAIAHKFAREGASVLVADLADMPVQDTVDGINDAGGRAVAFLGDLAEEEQARKRVKAALDAFGRVDILASNAGVFPEHKEVVDADIAGLDYMLRNGIRTAFLMTRFTAPDIRKTRGSIVFTGSLGGIEGVPHIAAYTGTKEVPDDLRREPEMTLPVRHRFGGFKGKFVVNPVGTPPEHRTN